MPTFESKTKTNCLRTIEVVTSGGTSTESIKLLRGAVSSSVCEESGPPGSAFTHKSQRKGISRSDSELAPYLNNHISR